MGSSYMTLGCKVELQVLSKPGGVVVDDCPCISKGLQQRIDLWVVFDRHYTRETSVGPCIYNKVLEDSKNAFCYHWG